MGASISAGIRNAEKKIDVSIGIPSRPRRSRRSSRRSRRSRRSSRRSRRSSRRSSREFVTELRSNGLSTLYSNDGTNKILSKNKQFKFVFQSDGNMVIKNNNTNAIVWQTNTHRRNNGRYRIVVQEDGNLVAYDNTDSYWSSDTYTLVKGGDKIQGPFTFSVTNNGKPLLENRYRPIWTNGSLWNIKG